MTGYTGTETGYKQDRDRPEQTGQMMDSGKIQDRSRKGTDKEPGIIIGSDRQR